MKTQIISICSISAMVFLFLGGCAKESSSSNSSNNGAPAPTTYVMSNGICYDANTCQPAQQNLCAQQPGSTGYIMYYGRCYNSAQQEVPMTYCQTATQCGQQQYPQYPNQQYPNQQYPQYPNPQYQQYPGFYFYYW